jgi:hypothetical protein
MRFFRDTLWRLNSKNRRFIRNAEPIGETSFYSGAQSGISPKQFCQQQSPSPHALTWWKAKYRDELHLPYRALRKSSSHESKHRFLEVKVFGLQPKLRHEAVLVDRRTIRVGDRFDSENCHGYPSTDSVVGETALR